MATDGFVRTAPTEHLDVADDEEFRAQLRAFLTANRPGKPPKGEREDIEHAKAWWRGAFDAGWASPALPREWGGMDLPFARQLIYAEETARARVPGFPGTGLGIAAPTIVRHGTREQQARWLPAMMRADLVWAQGYSEPGAGSDLPSLRTTAVRDGEHYVVTGQKVWGTQAHLADVLYTLVRTGPPDSRQRGISYLVIDLHAPGVTARPLKDMTGSAKFGEVFLDEVRVPVTDRIGEENSGWSYARTSLGHERAAGALTQAGFYRRVGDELLALARERGLADDPGWRRRLGGVEADVQVLQLSALRMIEHIQRHDEPGPTSSMSRLQITSLEQRLHEMALDMLGPEGILMGDAPGAVQRGRWALGYLRTRASTIGAGTSEIQRNTIAEQVLQLPRDPAMPR